MNVPRDVGGTADAIPRWRGVAALGGLITLVVLAYGPAYGSGFIWDDDAYVTTNLTLRSLAGLWRIWLEPGAVPQYYPLVHTTFWIEHHLWGSNAAGYHIVNVLLHALVAVLLYRVLSRLRVPGAWLAAAVFALHPVQVESVSWVTERKNVLSGLLYMASLLAWLRWDPGLSGDGRRRGYLGSLALYLGALLSKTVTASLPAVILLLQWWKAGRIERRAVRAVVPFFGVGLLMSAVTIVMEKHTVGAQGADWDLSFLQRLLIAGRALWFYLGKLVWPSNLTFIYPRWEPSGFGAAMTLSLLAALLLVVALFLARRRIGRGPLTALLFFGGTLFPALGFIDVYPMRYSFVADHFQYLACLGPIVLGVAAAVLLAPASWRARPIAGMVVAAVLVLGLGMATWKRADAFRSLESLWADTLRKNPSAWMAHHNLAMLREEQGRFEEAAREYQSGARVASGSRSVALQSGQRLGAVSALDRCRAGVSGGDGSQSGARAGPHQPRQRPVPDRTGRRGDRAVATVAGGGTGESRSAPQPRARARADGTGRGGRAGARAPGCAAAGRFAVAAETRLDARDLSAGRSSGRAPCAGTVGAADPRDAGAAPGDSGHLRGGARRDRSVRGRARGPGARLGPDRDDALRPDGCDPRAPRAL
ncbi:MAG: hypothetical protein R3E12_12220 [Candidatus Eisenbacteria bacterium]